jgi:hypothetical protein
LAYDARLELGHVNAVDMHRVISSKLPLEVCRSRSRPWT